MTPIITGQTPDGKTVVYASLFKWKDQEGLPLDITINHIAKEGYIPNWLAELEGGLWLGLSIEQIMSELNEAFQLLYPGKSRELIELINNYVEFRNTPNPYTLFLLKLTKP